MEKFMSELLGSAAFGADCDGVFGQIMQGLDAGIAVAKEVQ